ncbi:adenylate/guanylate cyclase domain-containing protein [Reinekea marina]|uniref:Adenylate/guanylate cyclase domain-containing protein n=1 Tax=Reinekea marina TaxID=1310421 RepID=A0ABV7WUG4_9GAMM|nr:adenylate/guanylate cyclase domain-containing protein [Reinekea marina]MDN3650161.1 adenylate/guanylate cyclase domain-containing protein [Reinekea marina]
MARQKTPQHPLKKSEQKSNNLSQHEVTQELELFDDFTVLPISAEFNSRSIIYLTLAGTLVSSISFGSMSSLFSLVVAFCLLYPTFIRFLSLPLRRQHPKQIGYTLILFDAFFIGAILTVMGLPLEPTIFILIMANASFIALGGAMAYLLCVLFLFGGAAASYSIQPNFMIHETSTLMMFIAAFGTGLYVAVTAYYTNQSARRLKVARLDAYQQNEKYRTISRQLSKYLSPQVWESVFSGKRDVKLETTRKRLVVFFSDIKGFSELSEQMESEALTELINTYLTEMSRIVMKHGGTIDKFIGDAIMVFFGDPETKGVKKDAEACVSMAIEMRRHMKVLRQRWKAQGIKHPLEIRMGINTGYCTVGNFGAETRMDYTLLGKEVNLASRLESASEPGEILVSYETYSLIQDRILCKEKGQIRAKGFSRPVPVYQVIDFRRDLGGSRTFTEVEMDGFSMALDLEKIKNYDKDRILEALEKVKKTVVSKTIP